MADILTDNIEAWITLATFFGGSVGFLLPVYPLDPRLSLDRPRFSSESC